MMKVLVVPRCCELDVRRVVCWAMNGYQNIPSYGALCSSCREGADIVVDFSADPARIASKLVDLLRAYGRVTGFWPIVLTTIEDRADFDSRRIPLEPGERGTFHPLKKGIAEVSKDLALEASRKSAVR